MLRRLPILASCILLCLGCDTAAKQQQAEDARRATSSRSRAPALERTAPEAPASRILNEGWSLRGSVFRGWSLGTRNKGVGAGFTG